MKTSLGVSAMAALASATTHFDSSHFDKNDGSAKIVYPGEQVDLIRIDRSAYPMVFKWPENSFRCGATMISPQVALTAAHCVREYEDSGNPNLQVRLGDGQLYGIESFRTNECWWNMGQPFSADIAMMYLDRPVEGAEEGTHYIKMWDADTQGSVEGREFILAGWGASGEVLESGSESHLQYEIFHRGYNVVNEITGNMLEYTFDRPEDGGLDLESMGHYGDSGSGALLVENGELYIIGVKSNGGPAQWDTTHQYTRVGGYHRDWIDANLASDTRIPAANCGADDDSSGDGGSGDAGGEGNCRNTNLDSSGNRIGDSYGDYCDEYTANPGWCGQYDTEDFNSGDMCCACNGGDREEEGDTGDDGTGGDGEGDTGGDGEGEDDNTGGDEGTGECVDTNYDDDGNEIGDSANDGCAEYAANPGWCGGYDTDNFDSGNMCCACNGGSTG